jgi:CelD/BcsL family acetyltransferase involved in cellulose biosynthesis
MLDVTMAADGAAPPSAAGSPALTSDGFRVQVHHDLSVVTGRWRALERGGRTTAFQRLDWVSLAVTHLGSKGKVRLLVVEVTDRGGAR